MASRKISGKTQILGLIAVLIFVYHAALGIRWVSTDRQPPNWDPAVHLSTTYDYYEALKDGRLSGLVLAKPKPGHPQYPPLYHYSLLPIIAGESPEDSVYWPNLFYLMVLVLSSGWLAWKLGGLWPAAAAMTAIGLSPRIAHIMPEVFADIPLAAWVTLTYALIIHSGFFERRKESLWAGLAAALAVMTKWGAVFYFVPVVFSGLKSKRTRRNFALASGLILILCAPWYIINSVQMVPRIWHSAFQGHSQGNPLTWTWANWLYYVRYLAAFFSLPGLLLLIGGSLAALKKIKKQGDARPKLIVAAWLFFSYVFCTLVPSKDDRYFIPIIPALAALGFSGLPAPALAVSGALAIFHGRSPRRPDTSDWHVSDILSAVRAEKKRDTASLCLLANHRNINTTTLKWIARHQGYRDISFGCQESEIPEWADFVLIKIGDEGAYLTDTTHRILRQIKEGKGLFRMVFEKARSWDLPDGSSAVLYRQRDDAPFINEKKRFRDLVVRRAKIKNLELIPTGPGHYELRMEEILIEKLPAPIRNVRMKLEGARLVQYEGKVYVLALDRLTLLSAEILWNDLENAIAWRSKLPVVVGEADGDIRTRIELGPLPIGTDVSVETKEDSLRVSLKRLRLWGIKVPFAKGSWDFPLKAKPPQQPYDLILGRLTISEDGLKISSP